IALYQLKHTSAPAHAIVDNAVETASRLQLTSAKGLVNAVLRFYLRNKGALDSKVPSTDEARFSHPQWWVDRVRDEYPEQWNDILVASNQRPPLTLRVNRRKSVRD